MIRIAQLLLVVAALGLWVASRLPWVELQTADGLGPARTVTLNGATWSTALVPLAVLLIAAALAPLAVRGWALRALAVLVAVVSALAGYLGLSLFRLRDISLRAADLAEVQVVSLVGSEREPWGASITVAAAVCTLAAAVLLLRGAIGKADGRYARRATSQPADPAEPMTERNIWDALDEGQDPTAEPGSEGR